MIKKILIANRGEIAIRIARTIREMGLESLAIYSEEDRFSEHVEACDDSVCLGDDPLKDSYLNMDKIINIAQNNSCDAIHPGYGFLSENYNFARKLLKNKIIFIGPPFEAIRDMGDKIESKKIARKAGVNCIPGNDEVILNEKMAIKIANEVGYPVMIKASSGGGGKGMRIAFNDKDIISGIVSAQNESLSSFGDNRVFIEKYIENPRHIEIQIIADKSGNTVWLGERECSIQRRHQKVIEEAPSSFIDEKLRKEMGEQATMLAKAVGYYSVGTVEYVVSQDKSFYFLEMNTRLQVEHPVTEMTIKKDLVKEMIEVAQGNRLTFKQKDIQIDGWSFEARVCAENPIRNFLPSTGRITKYIAPEDNKGVRVDSGFKVGSLVSMFYDPLIAKIITKGKNRKEALEKMIVSLDSFVISGVETNISFLSSLFRNKKFLKGEINTNFIAKEYPDGYKATTKNIELINSLAINITVAHVLDLSCYNISEKNIINKWCVNLLENVVIIDVISKNKNSILVALGSEKFEVFFNWDKFNGLAKISINNDKIFTLKIKQKDDKYLVEHKGLVFSAIVNNMSTQELLSKLPKKKALGYSNVLKSPMPGRVVKVIVKKGEEVELGSDLVVLDAMKMENILKAEAKVFIDEVLISEGDIVATDQVLVKFKIK